MDDVKKLWLAFEKSGRPEDFLKYNRAKRKETGIERV